MKASSSEARMDRSARKTKETKLSERDKALYYEAVGLVLFTVDIVYYKAGYAASQLARSLRVW